ncbi:MAG: type II toxin-antitoxin system RelE/ParE family toxin [Anaerolineaceae bacterium]|nr:type II toxin-antitoxin system RelE/ParE family toxin [Anaerolineaceae bacterium]
MAYKLIVSDKADGQLDSILSYVTNKLKNPEAAGEILDEILDVYEMLVVFPESFALCNDPILAEKGYRKCLLSHHEYVILYLVCEEYIRISGIFHARENYLKKL